MVVPDPGRTPSDYRYGFNGKESDNELKGGEGNSYDYGARMYDPRAGRWFARDSYFRKYPSISPYAFSKNSPLMYNDPDGRDIVIKIYVNSNGENMIDIFFDTFTDTEEHAAEMQAGIGLWENLNGSKILLNDVEFTVNISTCVEICGSMPSAIARQAENSFSNAYGGNLKEDGTQNTNNVVIKPSVNTVTNEDGSKTSTYSAPGYSIEGANSNGSYITATTTNISYDFSGLTKNQKKEFKQKIDQAVNKTIYGGNNSKVMSHEIGHNFGLQHDDSYLLGIDGTTNFFDPSGTMTNKDFNPTYTDLVNVIKSAFLKQGLGRQSVEFVGDEVIDILNPPGSVNEGEYPKKSEVSVEPVNP